MADPERRLWTNRVKPALGAIPGLAYDRIETGRVTVGVPDVVYSCNGRTGFIELKVGNTLRGWSQRQRRWTQRHVACGAVVWLILATDRGDVVLDAAAHLTHTKPHAPWPLTSLRDLL